MSVRANWTEPSELKLLEALLEHSQRGNRSAHGFTRDAWHSVTNQLQQFGPLTREQVKNKFQQLRKRYDLFQKLKDNSNFGWDDARKVVTAPDHVWDEYLKSKPKAKEFRFHTLSNYDLLHKIVTGTNSTGPFQATGADSSNLQSNLTPAALRSNGTGLAPQAPQNAEAAEDCDSSSSEIEASAPVVDPIFSRWKRRRASSPVTNTPPSKRRPLRSVSDESEASAESDASFDWTIGVKLLDAVRDLSKSLTDVHEWPHTTLQEATDVFLEDFAHLEPDMMIKAIRVLENSNRAATFLRLPKGPLREKWLLSYCKEIP